MLTTQALLTLLSPFADQKAATFTGFPATGEDAAQRWASAAAQWVALVTPPTAGQAAAEAAFLVGMRLCTVGGDMAAFARAWHKLAVAAGAGMVGWVAVPPVAPPVLAPVYQLGLGGATNRACLERLAQVVLAWITTGTATSTAVPSPITWS